MLINSEQVTETIAPSVEPVTLTEAKSHLRVDISDDDTLISSLITAARQWAENYCQQSFAEHTYRADLYNFADMMVLPYRPILSISSVKYYNTDSPEVLTTLSTNVYGLQGATVFRNYGQSWPTAWAPFRPNAVQITYVTGWDTPASPTTVAGVPETVKRSILLMVADLYENREGQFANNFSTVQPNKTVEALLHPYRVYL